MTANPRGADHHIGRLRNYLSMPCRVSDPAPLFFFSQDSPTLAVQFRNSHSIVALDPQRVLPYSISPTCFIFLRLLIWTSVFHWIHDISLPILLACLRFVYLSSSSDSMIEFSRLDSAGRLGRLARLLLFFDSFSFCIVSFFNLPLPGPFIESPMLAQLSLLVFPGNGYPGLTFFHL